MNILILFQKITFLRFTFIGFVNVVLDFSFFYMFFNILNNIVLANILTISIVSVIGFSLHYKYTFLNKSFQFSQYIKYFVIVLMSLAIGTYLIIFFFDLTSNVYVSKILQIIAMIFFNYYMYKMFVFKK